MSYIYLLCAICFSACISIFGTVYNNKNADLPNVSRIYSFAVSVSVCLGWLTIYAFDFSFDPGVLWYSLLYGVFYAIFTIGLINALKTGSVSLTAFLKQISLACVSLWGFLFWGTPFTLNVAIGLVLIIAALYLCLLGGKTTETRKANLKWVLYVAMVMVSNAACSIIQKYEHMAFDGQHGVMMMVFATAMAAVINLILALQEDRTHWGTALKRAWFAPFTAGLSSTLTNQFILLMISTALPASLIYPGIAVGGLMLTVLVSVVAFHEKLSRRKWLGLAIGAVALVFLNL